MNGPLPPQLVTALEISGALADAAVLTIRAAHKAYREVRRRPRETTLRPGSDTPLWNELAAEALRLIRKRGDKANLGRYLGLPRQRIHQYLMEKSAAPDAERTLRLLNWVRARQLEAVLPRSDHLSLNT